MLQIKNLYLSHQEFDWSTRPDLMFINRLNYQKSLGDCCTSLEDIGSELIDLIVDSARFIHLIDLDLDRLQNLPQFNAYSRLWYKLATAGKPIIGGEWLTKLTPAMFSLGQHRADSPLLFAAGCSFTKGTGVPADQRYISIVSESLELPMIDLSEPGASIPYAADKILRSDVRAQDTVVWGISSLPRISIFDGTKENCYTLSDYHNLISDRRYWSIDYFDSETAAFVAVQSIERVKNFCDKIDARLLLVNFLETSWIPLLYRDDPRFLDLHKDVYDSGNDWHFADIGDDGIHPGILQHQRYANAILEHYARLY